MCRAAEQQTSTVSCPEDRHCLPCKLAACVPKHGSILRVCRGFRDSGPCNLGCRPTGAGTISTYIDAASLRLPEPRKSKGSVAYVCRMRECICSRIFGGCLSRLRAVAKHEGSLARDLGCSLQKTRQTRYDNSGAVPDQPSFDRVTFTDEDVCWFFKAACVVRSSLKGSCRQLRFRNRKARLAFSGLRCALPGTAV